ncbi:hypothetical protein E4631_22415 [Hymenobacter sp. UV11]|uniref:hypothetical protein n=1 Tax=Hymenobacter sp. UV11 TaxID=1849735 RepID=UPI00105D6072|nr:hypothetical protein [Hymenobacter sp. UV11]TDN38742.1 hypothetical protein A8B98_00345 [Hymenobacter sp. UV11]TFZ63435.1 hypothetical protein E4631_22415 [Hymenobacter sp. UV11]
MFSATVLLLLPVHPAMLLVLLPTVGTGTQQETLPHRTATNLLPNNLQLRLGSAIQVLKVDEGSHPAVVQAFDGRTLVSKNSYI